MMARLPNVPDFGRGLERCRIIGGGQNKVIWGIDIKAQAEPLDHARRALRRREVARKAQISEREAEIGWVAQRHCVCAGAVAVGRDGGAGVGATDI